MALIYPKQKVMDSRMALEIPSPSAGGGLGWGWMAGVTNRVCIVTTTPPS